MSTTRPNKSQWDGPLPVGQGNGVAGVTPLKHPKGWKKIGAGVSGSGDSGKHTGGDAPATFALPDGWGKKMPAHRLRGQLRVRAAGGGDQNGPCRIKKFECVTRAQA